MDKMLISLKNIYRLLMVQDFPVYSEAVFSEKNRRGLTLVKFWQTYLAEDFYTGEYGKMIWRSEGKRNRHISSVINRNGNRPAYDRYEAECVRLLTPQVLKRQQQLFAEFLKEREFSGKAFLCAQAVTSYQNACTSEDLTGINDHISQSPPCPDKFTDHHANQTKPDIYLHNAE